MVGVPRLTEEELRARDERQREWRRQYNARPEVIEYQREWHKKDNQDPLTKEAHRKSQARFKNTVKGRACDDRYWKKKNSKGRG